MIAASKEPSDVIPISQQLMTRLSADWQHPLKPALTSQVARHDKQAGFMLTDRKPALVGIATHKILEQIAIKGLDWWAGENQWSQQRYINSLLKQQGIATQHCVMATEMVRKCIQNTLSDQRGKWILQAHPEAQSELAITAIINGVPKSVVIDRTFVADDVRWIIDYKTTTWNDGQLQHFLTSEQEKYLEKMSHYLQAMQYLDVRPIRLGLYFPALPAWREWAGASLVSQ